MYLFFVKHEVLSLLYLPDNVQVIKKCNSVLAFLHSYSALTTAKLLGNASSVHYMTDSIENCIKQTSVDVRHVGMLTGPP